VEFFYFRFDNNQDELKGENMGMSSVQETICPTRPGVYRTDIQKSPPVKQDLSITFKVNEKTGELLEAEFNKLTSSTGIDATHTISVKV